MRWIAHIGREVLGLFVDDGSFALAILAWLAAAWLLLPRVGVPAEMRGVVFTAGLVVVLAWSALRAARKASR